MVSSVGLASALWERESGYACKLLQATGVSALEVVRTSAFHDWLLEQRRLVNAPGGLVVLGVEPDAADRLATIRLYRAAVRPPSSLPAMVFPRWSSFIIT